MAHYNNETVTRRKMNHKTETHIWFFGRRSVCKIIFLNNVISFHKLPTHPRLDGKFTYHPYMCNALDKPNLKQLPCTPEYQLVCIQLPCMPENQLVCIQLPCMTEYQLVCIQLPCMPEYQLVYIQLPCMPEYQLVCIQLIMYAFVPNLIHKTTLPVRVPKLIHATNR